MLAAFNIQKSNKARQKMSYFILLFILLASLSSNNLMAQGAETDQQAAARIKVAYLFNFLKYIKFGSDEQDIARRNYSICIFGSNPFGSALDSIRGRKAKGKPVHLLFPKTIQDTQPCQVLYLNDFANQSMNTLLGNLQNQAILTVSESPNFIKKGGTLGFVNDKNKIGIEINLTNAHKANLRISALLLEIARITD